MKIQSLKEGGNFIEMPKSEKDHLAFLLGEHAFKESLKVSESDTDPSTKRTMIDDVDIVFEYLYLNHPNTLPDKEDLTITLSEGDRFEFTDGWEAAETSYYLGEGNENSFYEERELGSGARKVTMSTAYGVFGKKGDNDEDEDLEDGDFKWFDRKGKYAYPYKPYVEPTFIYDRFNKIESSSKVIVFPENLSKLFWDIFQTASGKEIMFYGEIENSEEAPDTYTVKSMNFPPQKNYGGYVETVDGDYEMWAFKEIILKGRRVPLHVHTHPDFSAFSSSVDETQIKQYIKDNEGNPFVIQLIVSNPRKGTYFIRWFDLVNNTWEKPAVKFTYETYDVEANYPGIFQFNAPRVITSSLPAPTSLVDSKPSDRAYFDYNIKDEEDEEGPDLFEPEAFDNYFKKKYGNMKF